jgi:Enoyl-(Acyl carrier protein) reductase
MSQRQVRPVGSNDSVRGTAAYDRRSPRDPVEQHARWASDILRGPPAPLWPCGRGAAQLHPSRPRIGFRGGRHFASALGARGIRVNAVAPGVVQTDMSNFTKTDAGRDYTFGMQALKRLAEPDDIGGVVAFLASDHARWITGDTVRVDGGSKL